MQQDEGYLKDYVRSLLPADAMAAADRRYATEPAFAQEVDEMRLLMELAEMSLRARMREEAQAAEVRARVQARARMPRMAMWAAAAAAVLLVTVGIVWMLQPSQGERIFREYFEHSPRHGSSLGAGNSLPAFRKYDEHRYDTALVLLRAIPRSDGSWDEAQFYIAVSLLALDSTEAGVAGMQGYLEGHDADDARFAEAQWYLGLGLLRLGRLEEGRSVLAKLLDAGGGDGHGEAILEILGRLR
jgi:hypothetical protein